MNNSANNSNLRKIAESLNDDLEGENAFYFIRHGQTDANFNQVMSGGEWDVPINETGVAQAHKAIETAYEGLSEIKVICVSPMLRARQTAEIINAKLNLPIVIVEELREWLIGEWEGKPWGEIPDPFTKGNDPPGGETRADFEKRAELGLRKCLQNRGPILLVAHGGVLHALATPLGFKSLIIDNCVFHEIYRDAAGQPWQLKILN
ncbi:MAG: histidine phosphatase family protein [Candidatus Obscuribacterales bacterium]|jgi:probable phosphoglycerate mutase|nr:histidine phosphatase family protein [Candidatus Obscuribacterales bacterium]